MTIVTIHERLKCRCDKPTPGLRVDLFGARECTNCKKVVNWTDFEPKTEVAT